MKDKATKKQAAFDVPEKNPDDAFLLCQRNYLKSNRSPILFNHQTPHKQAMTQANDLRFEPFLDISDWNGKYESKI